MARNIDRRFKTTERVPASAKPDDPRIERRMGVSRAVPQVGQPELRRKKLATIPVLWSWSDKFCLRKCSKNRSRPTSTDCTNVIAVRNKKSGKVRPTPKTARKVLAKSTILPRRLDNWKSCQLAAPAAKKFRRNPKIRKVKMNGSRKWRWVNSWGRVRAAKTKRSVIRLADILSCSNCFLNRGLLP